MSGGRLGADPEDLRRLASAFERAGEGLEDDARQIGTKIRASGWDGAAVPERVEVVAPAGAADLSAVRAGAELVDVTVYAGPRGVFTLRAGLREGRAADELTLVEVDAVQVRDLPAELVVA